MKKRIIKIVYLILIFSIFIFASINEIEKTKYIEKQKDSLIYVKKNFDTLSLYVEKQVINDYIYEQFLSRSVVINLEYDSIKKYRKIKDSLFSKMFDLVIKWKTDTNVIQQGNKLIIKRAGTYYIDGKTIRKIDGSANWIDKFSFN